MKLGSVIYFIPFIFVMDPALLLEGNWEDVLFTFGRAAGGIWLIVAGLQGYLQGFGHVRNGPLRLVLVAGGLAVAFANLLL